MVATIASRCACWMQSSFGCGVGPPPQPTTIWAEVRVSPRISADRMNRMLIFDFIIDSREGQVERGRSDERLKRSLPVNARAADALIAGRTLGVPNAALRRWPYRDLA